MGTRNLTAVVADGKYRIAQYGQWDGNPGGQGITVLEFCRKMHQTFGWAKFREQLAKVRFADDTEFLALAMKYGASCYGDMNSQDSFKFYRQYPSLSRDMAAEILDYVYEAKGEVLTKNEIAFAADSLFCEWAYVIDLDKGVLEAYTGFNESPLGPEDRFFNMPLPALGDPDSKYYPVKLVGKYSLDDLPFNKDFIEQLDPSEED
jgi:hypothetical protein